MPLPTKAERFLHAYGGIAVLAEWALPDLPLGSLPIQSPALTLQTMGWHSLSLTPGARAPRYSLSGRFGLTAWRMASGWFFRSREGVQFHLDSTGNRILFHHGLAPWSSLAEDFFVSRILPRAVQLHGHRTVHASAVCKQGRAIMLCGRSGAGKSTLAAFLVRERGWRLLADDACVLAAEGDRTWVHPTSRGLYLLGDSVASLGGTRESRTRRTIPGVKVACLDPAPAPVPAASLTAIYLLDPPAGRSDDAAEPGIEDIPPAQAVLSLAPLMMRLDPTDRRDEGELLRFLARLCGRLPARNLRYPRSYGLLGRVAELLEAGAAEIQP